MYRTRATLTVLIVEGVLLFAFADVDNEKPWCGDLVDFPLFSFFVQVAERTGYGVCS